MDTRGTGMFGFGVTGKIKKVYKRLNEVEFLENKTAEEIIPEKLIVDLLKITTHIETIVAVIAVMRQAQFAEQFYKIIEYEKSIEEYRKISKKKGITFAEVFKWEVDGQVESAIAYGENLAERFDRGELENSQYIRHVCSQYVARMLVAWMMFRIKMRETANYWDS